MVDFDNPLDQEFLDELYKGKREVIGDDFTRPRQFIIGRLNADGSTDTVVTKDEFGRVWVREPGEDTGDAVQAINTTLQPHEVSFNRPVMVKQERNKFLIVNKAPESANYDAQLPVAPQRPTNREQYNVALITPSSPDTSFFAYYRGGMFQLNNVTYRITDIPSSDLSGTVPMANALSIKVELDPTTGTWHETTGGAFTFSSMAAAFKNGDLDTARTTGRYLIGWIRLYDGQAAIELEDILSGEHMLDIMEDHDQLINRDSGDQHANYVYLAPTSDGRNLIQPTGAFRSLGAKDSGGVQRWYFEENGDLITDPAEVSNTRLGNDVGLPNGGSGNTFIGEISGGAATASDNTFVGWESGNAISSGARNVAIGSDAIWQITTGDSNTSIGTSSLADLETGDENVAVGDRALENTTGNNNTAIGFQAGTVNITGTDNVYLGYKAGGTGNADSNELYINNSQSDTPLIYGDFSTPALKIYGSTVFNEDGIASYDLRWESDTEAEMLFGDASTNQLFFGGTTNAAVIDKGGDTYWIGTGGLIGGHMYIPGVTIGVNITDANPTEVADAADGDGWAAGELNRVTFPTGGDEHYLQITEPGIYRVIWDMSFNMVAPGANIEVHGGIMIDGVATRNKGEAHRTIANNTDTGNMGANGRIDCPLGTEQISLWVQNQQNNNNIGIKHGNMDIELVAGT